MRRVNWNSVGPKLLGYGILVFCVVFWAITDRVEPLFVTAGGGLLAIDQAGGALVKLHQSPPEPPIPVQGNPKVDEER